ncbi:MAG TPA: RNA 2',3'-cyclic phosphodiesterase [Mesotoga sp.]|nr:RNA 2',3'-cyclic phosphodiesterase [Mesotoga sp.]
MRSFIAVDTGDRVSAMIDSISERLRRMGFKASWVPGVNSHVTLAFLDNIEPERLSLLASMLSRRLRGFPSFTLETGGIGYFKHKDLPKVIWVGIERNQSLINLQRETRVVLEAMNLPVEDNFRPHLTVGRMKFSPPMWRKFLSTLDNERVIFPVGEATIFESILSREGARYRKVFTCSFEGGLIEHAVEG